MNRSPTSSYDSCQSASPTAAAAAAAAAAKGPGHSTCTSPRGQRCLSANGPRALAVVDEDLSLTYGQTFVISDMTQDDCPIVFASEAFSLLTGFSRDEVIGRNCRFLQGPDTNRETVKAIKDAIAAEEPLTVNLLNYRKDGSKFWNQLQLVPVKDASGRAVQYVGAQHEIRSGAPSSVSEFVVSDPNMPDNPITHVSDGGFSPYPHRMDVITRVIHCRTAYT